MSEFMEKFSVSRIIGSPPGYVGYDEAGQLTEKIRRKPYSVILFDEIEKAHPDVMNILLQILDDGRITDAQGRVVNFENTVIIMTTNAGSSSSSGSVGFGSSLTEMSRERSLKALGEFLRPEFINRVDEVVCFNSLSEENFRSIAELMLNEVKDCLNERNIALSWDDRALDYLVKKGYSVNYGARNLRRLIQKEVEDRVAQKIIESHGLLDSVSLKQSAGVRRRRDDGVPFGIQRNQGMLHDRRKQIRKNKTVAEILLRAVCVIDDFFAEFAGMGNDRIAVETACIDMQNIVILIPWIRCICNAL